MLTKFYLHVKDLYEAKYQLLINKHKGASLKNFNNSIEYSIDMDDIYKNTEEYNPGKEPKLLVLFHDMISDMLSNKNSI